MGDIHGAYRALLQCLERSNFNKDIDTLIQIGDVCDGWSETWEVVEELLKIRNLIPIRGNHDDWFLQFIVLCSHPVKWRQGGSGTAKSYLRHIGKEDYIIPNGDGYVASLIPEDIPLTHQRFFKDQINYYVHDNTYAFVHGGFDRDYPIKDQYIGTYIWDRDFWNEALCCKNGRLKWVDDFVEVFIGHTATTNWRSKEERRGEIIILKGDPIDYPMHSGGVWNIDTGAGWEGRLTIMDIITKEYWQSDRVEGLYPDEAGRR